ncbi:MAG TPA: hypothetical protein VEA80_20370 [Vitreimonas sp.]|uniref:hypothetical protein n=1 Tax=Vitreimonas sp. TaxID=3069702 RepID=UPI002D41D1E1|nr:hypothetical protein [Vitreimonas sp.]HYD89846.1 hypothetical protein [Vitreimonas sp.]
MAARGAPATAAPLAAAVTRKGSVPWLILRWGGQTLLDAVLGKITARDAALNPGAKRSPENPTGCSEAWLNCGERTRKGYIASLRPVFAWSITLSHRHVKTMTPLEIDDFLSRWNDVPGQRKNVRGALSQIFSTAMRAGEIREADIPLNSVKATRRKRVKGGRRVKVDRWSRADVAAYADTARTVRAWRPHAAGRNAKAQRPWPGGAIAVQLMYETAADSTDVIVWTLGEHLKTKRIDMPDGETVIVEGIEFDRGKTGVPAFLPLSRALVAEIRADAATRLPDAADAPVYLVSDPFGQPYTPVVDDARLRGHMITLREKVVAGAGPYRVFDHLRHSAITEGVEAGVDLDDMRHLSAHADSDMNREVYIQKSAVKAVEIQRARGLLK